MDRQIIFEFGGIVYNQTNQTSEKRSSQEDLWEESYQERSGQGVKFHDSGGVLANDPWDLHTNEQLRSNVDIPFSSWWWYNGLPSAADLPNPQAVFQNLFRQFSIVSEDIVLLSTVDSSLDTSDEAYLSPAFKSSDFTTTFS